MRDHDIDEASLEDVRIASEARDRWMKKKPCKFLRKDGHCKNGSACKFSHGSEGMRQEERLGMAIWGSQAAIGSCAPTPFMTDASVFTYDPDFWMLAGYNPATTTPWMTPAGLQVFQMPAWPAFTNPSTPTTTAAASRQDFKRTATTNQSFRPPMAPTVASRRTSNQPAATATARNSKTPPPPKTVSRKSTPAASAVQPTPTNAAARVSPYPAVDRAYKAWTKANWKSEDYKDAMLIEKELTTEGFYWDEALGHYVHHGLSQAADDFVIEALKAQGGMWRRKYKSKRIWNDKEFEAREMVTESIRKRKRYLSEEREVDE